MSRGQEAYNKMIEELERIDRMVESFDKSNSRYISVLFNATHTRFTVEWKCGSILLSLLSLFSLLRSLLFSSLPPFLLYKYIDLQKAMDVALASVTVFKENATLLGLW